MVGWPNDGVPFFVVVEPGTAKEEKICVKYNTSTLLTVVNPADTSVWGEHVLGRGALAAAVGPVRVAVLLARRRHAVPLQTPVPL
jgi:hypothetical protein